MSRRKGSAKGSYLAKGGKLLLLLLLLVLLVLLAVVIGSRRWWAGRSVSWFSLYRSVIRMTLLVAERIHVGVRMKSRKHGFCD